MSIFGIIAPRSGAIEDISQECCSLDMWSSRYKQVMLDSNVAGVIVNCDSPGGNVYQVAETAALIRSLRGLKPNVAVCTGMAASACFYLYGQFKERVCCRSAEVGSIGVLMRHQDVSKMADELGVKNTYITSPRDGNKAEGNPFTPLSPESLEYLNSRTDEYYDMFLDDLSAGFEMGKSGKARIDQDWGRGRMIGAQMALSLGMVDRIGTLQGEIDKMAQSLSKGKGGMRMEAEIEAGAVMETEVVAAANDDSEMVRARARLRLA
jgi:signal peptide peptidase SppA